MYVHRPLHLYPLLCSFQWHSCLPIAEMVSRAIWTAQSCGATKFQMKLTFHYVQIFSIGDVNFRLRKSFMPQALSSSLAFAPFTRCLDLGGQTPFPMHVRQAKESVRKAFGVFQGSQNLVPAQVLNWSRVHPSSSTPLIHFEGVCCILLSGTGHWGQIDVGKEEIVSWLSRLSPVMQSFGTLATIPKSVRQMLKAQRQFMNGDARFRAPGSQSWSALRILRILYLIQWRGI